MSEELKSKFRGLIEIEGFLGEFIAAKFGVGVFGDGLGRMRKLMELLGDPQEDFRVVHVAGTSGKGSTAYCVAAALGVEGVKCGLMVSPFVDDFRERIQVGGEFAEISLIGESLEEMVWAIDEVEKLGFGKLSYFEIVTALGFLVFKKAGVQVAVVETGIGGRLDATNVVRSGSKVCVLTKIGFDHEEILGEKIEMIAEEKAGIVNAGSLVVVMEQEKEVNEVFEKKFLEMGARGVWVSENVVKGSLVDFGKVWEMVELGFRGRFGVINVWMGVVVAVLVLKEIGVLVELDLGLVEKMLSEIRDLKIPGRMEKRIFEGREIWVDGAHNPQKIEFALRYLRENVGGKFAVLVAFKKGKNLRDCLKLIVDFADEIVVTEFNGEKDMVNRSVEGEEIVGVLRDLGFWNFKLVKNCELAVKEVSKSSCRGKLVIGSFYLIGGLGRNRNGEL